MCAAALGGLLTHQMLQPIGQLCLLTTEHFEVAGCAGSGVIGMYSLRPYWQCCKQAPQLGCSHCTPVHKPCVKLVLYKGLMATCNHTNWATCSRQPGPQHDADSCGHAVTVRTLSTAQKAKNCMCLLLLQQILRRVVSASMLWWCSSLAQLLKLAGSLLAADAASLPALGVYGAAVPDVIICCTVKQPVQVRSKKGSHLASQNAMVSLAFSALSSLDWHAAAAAAPWVPAGYYG